jgi:hypothetical protein
MLSFHLRELPLMKWGGECTLQLPYKEQVHTGPQHLHLRLSTAKYSQASTVMKDKGLDSPKPKFSFL